MSFAPPPAPPFPTAFHLDEVHAKYAALKEDLYHAQLAFVRAVLLDSLTPPPITVIGSKPFFEFQALYPTHRGPAGSRVFSWAGEAPYATPAVYEQNAPPFVCKLSADRSGVMLGVRANGGFVDAVKVAGLEKRLVEMLRVREASEVEALAKARKEGQARLEAEARAQRAAIARQEDVLAEVRKLLSQVSGSDLVVPTLG
jgi:hypothetical protein